jgi:two-component system response regulator DevR
MKKGTNAPVKIMIVDDHELVRVGLKTLLEPVPGFQIVAEASDGQEAVAVVEELATHSHSLERKSHRSDDSQTGLPDVIVMDVRMAGGSGIDACRIIRARFPQIKVIMLTSYSDDEAIFASVGAGAAGYIMKEVGSDELIRAIHTVHAGGSLLDPETTRKVLEHVRSVQASVSDADGRRISPENTFRWIDSIRKRSADQTETLPELAEPLSDQEYRILALIAHGKTNREIAEDIYLSEKTVRNYVSNILGKLNLSNRAEAAAFAVRHGIAINLHA